MRRLQKGDPGMSRATTHTREGLELRDRLKAEGRHRDAQIVSQLVRSLTTARATMGILHGDNMKLRKGKGA